jgi:hypothetical protein
MNFRILAQLIRLNLDFQEDTYQELMLVLVSGKQDWAKLRHDRNPHIDEQYEEEPGNLLIHVNWI